MSSLSSLTIHRPVQSSYVAVIVRVAAAAAVRFNGFELHEVLTDRCVAARTRALISGLRRIASQVDSHRLWFAGVAAEGDCRERTSAVIPPKVIVTLQDQFVSTPRMMLRGVIHGASRVVPQALDIVANDDDAENSIGNIAAPQAWQTHGAELLAEVFAG